MIANENIYKLPNNTISTREKFGSLAKKVLKYLYDNRTKIFYLPELLQQAMKILKQQKKSIDVLCMYEGLGLITRTSPLEVVYTGFRGMSTRLMEMQQTRRRNIYPTIKTPSNDEFIFENKLVSMRHHLIAGLFISELFFNLIYLNGKTTYKNQIEIMVQEFSQLNKDTNTKSFFVDAMNILTMLGFVEKNQNTEIVSYIGP